MPQPTHDRGRHSAGGAHLLIDEADRRSELALPSGDAGSLSARAVITLLDLLDEERVTDPDVLSRLLAGEDVDRAVGHEITRRIQRVQAHLARAGRRRDELAALFASSRELAEQREFGELLGRLVRRAHDLLGADLTWLSEFDPANGDLEVRTATGTVSAHLEGVRVPAGQGLASFVVAHRRPHTSTRYHADPDFVHDVGADSALLAEGVVSTLAVPLIAGEDVIGTLIVATRTEMQFHLDQVALLTSFADHGAVILQGARQLAQARKLAEEADDSRRQLAHHVEAMERAHDHHAELTECVLRGEQTVQVAATLAAVMQREIMILDAEGTPTADSPAHFPVEGCWRHPEVAIAIAESRRTGRYVPTACPGVAGAVAVVAGSTSLGALLVSRNASRLTPGQHKTIEDAARIMALLRLKQDALADAEDRVRGELLNDLIESGTRSTDEIRLRARARGLDIDGLTRIFVLSVDDRQGEAIRALRGKAPRPALIAEHGGAVVMAFAGRDPVDAERIRETVRRRLRLPVLVVEAPKVRSCDEFAASYREARRCLAMLPALGIRDKAVTTAPYRLYMRLFEPDAQDIDDFVTATIGPLLDSDAQRGTDLLHTVSAFAEANASTTRTARLLHLHPNTVLQRLDRVGKLLGAHWRDPDEFFRVQVAVRVHTLRREAT
jgi:sugar diacid utilization regulator